MPFDDIAWIGILVVSIISAYISVVSILIYTHPLLFQDDWRHYYAYFFEKTFLESIFDRQNGHIMLLPNFIFYMNYRFLGGVMINLALVSVAVLGAVSGFFMLALVRGLKSLKVGLIQTIGIGSIALSVVLLLTAPVTLFWGIGVHNHLVVLGAVGAALFASGLLGPINKMPAFVGFVACATLASTSFSTGTAVWALGFVGAVALRCRARVLIGYLVVCALGGLATLGYLLFGQTVARVGEIPTLGVFAVAVPAFLGSAVGDIFRPGISRDTLLVVSTVVGFLGIAFYLLLALKVYQSMRREPGSELGRAYLFFLLVDTFVIGAGLLVGLGRAGKEAGILNVISPRFGTWSTLFWGALICAMFLATREMVQRYGAPRIVTVMVGATVALAVLAIDYHAIDSKLRYTHNTMVKMLTQVAINQETRTPEHHFFLRDSGEIIRRVVGDLRANRRNVYSQQWPHLMGGKLPASGGSLEARRCVGSFNLKPTTRGDEWIVGGWMGPKRSQDDPIKTAYFVDSTGTVVGFAKPIFGPPRRYSDAYLKARSVESIILQATHIPLLTDLPGISGHLLGRVLLEKKNVRDVKKEISVWGEDAEGRWCNSRKPFGKVG